MIRLGNPYFLGALWLVPGLIAFYVWAFRHKQRLLEQFVSPELKERLLSGVSISRQRAKAALLVLGTGFTILALLQPRWGFHWEEVKRRGVDIMLALDVSRSMLAEDVSPNRLERAKRKIIDFLRIVQGDRVGLIAFAGTAFLQCPLTLDQGAVQIFLDSVDTDLIPVPGTAINEAIDLAIKAFAKSERSSRALILITDGEQTTGNDLDAAKRAGEQGIKIYTIGIGKEGGAPIPNGPGGGFKKDRQGNVIMTKLDEEGLQKLALETGGSYVRSVSGDLDLDKIYEDIRKHTEEHELKSGRQKRFEERFQWPLLLAFLCFLAEALLSERKGGSLFAGIGVSARAGKGLLALVLIASGWPHCLQAASGRQGERLYHQKKYNEALKELVDAGVENPSSLALKYNTADAYYKLNRYAEAEKLFQAVATGADPKLAEKAYYNLGNTTYREGKLQEALAHFQKAIELDPKDEDAKHNLEVVRKEIRRRIEQNKNQKQPPQPQQNQGNNQKDGQKNGQQKQQPNRKDKDSAQKKNESEKSSGQAKKEEPKKDEPKKDGGQAQAQAKPGDPKENQGGGQPGQKMSDEEAKQWLSTLKEADRSKLRKREAEGEHQYEVEKDW